MMNSEIAAVKGFSEHEKMRPIHHHSSKSCKEKGSLPSGIKNVKNVNLLEKVGALKTEKLPRQTARDNHEGKNSVPQPLWTSQKPWPSRKMTCSDEPVKNMSNVPCYLQRVDKGDDIHDKALNFGVLDWGLLERWTYHKKCVTDVRGGGTAYTSTDSSTFSSFGFSNQYCRTMSSSLSRGMKSQSGLPQKKQSVTGSTSKTFEKENSKHIEDFCDSRISSTKFSIQHDKQPNADSCLVADISGHKHNESRSRNLDLNAMSHEVHLDPHPATSPSRYKIEDATTTRIAEDQSSSLTKEEMSEYYPDNSEMTNVMPPFPQDNNVRWDDLQGSTDSGCRSSDSSFTINGRLDERNCGNFSANLAEDFDIIHQYSHIPYSCPLPCTPMSDEPDVSGTLQLETVEQTEKSTFRNVDELSSRGTCKKHEVSTTQVSSRKSEVKATAAAGNKSSDSTAYASSKQRHTSCSLKGGSSEEQFESISCLYNLQGDQAIRNSKGRQSPLRRLLDPLLKPKNSVTLPSRHSCELSGTGKSSHGLRKTSFSSIDFTFQARRSVDTSNQSSHNFGKEIQRDDSPVAPMKQAFLQLAWKNGLPLFMLSSCDTEVLAATITLRSVSSNDDLDYRIFSLNDSKKKTMFWSNSGNKSKKHQLISNVVGQLKVSLCKFRSYDSAHDVREFVLLGDQGALTSKKPVENPLKSELAAIVFKVPLHKPKGLNIGTLCRNKRRGSLPSDEDLSAPNEEKDNPHDDDAKQPGISVILPSGVHGLSTDGEPSPLIQRWRSGGACDCGGWDEGCKLTILRDKLQEYNTFDSPKDCQNTHGTYRLELFVQGGYEEKHAFNMVSLREGKYLVNFLPSISVLQAFAICIASLHGRKLSNCSAESKSLHEQIVNDSTSYVPNHPPLSPVGRA
ncbi:hypothetical protein Cni_G09434 [Canna indica]|uniref:Uncharacterized protein n=1 Tax=Canna indica TaxID=4628 RepID=A0AAQ3Q8V8_9LILI|nr:hypothetical protein Cni_G09434 [Canna indica]